MLGGGEIDGRNLIVDGLSCNDAKLFPATSRTVVSQVPCFGLNSRGSCLECEDYMKLTRFEPNPISDSISDNFRLDVLLQSGSY